MTWKDFQVMVLAEERREVREWRRSRAVLHMLYSVNTTDKSRKTPEQFMPLPGDPKRDRGEVVTSDELVKRIQKMYGNGSRNAQA